MDPFTHIIVNLGFSAIIGSLRTISETSMNIQTIIRRFDSKTSNQQILQVLLESDIEATLEVIEQLFKHIKIDTIDSRPIHIVIRHIQDIIQQLEQELITIHEKDTWNRQLWVFYYIRAYNFNQHITRIQLLKRILDKRLDMLIKVLQIRHDLPMTSDQQPNPVDWSDDF